LKSLKIKFKLCCETFFELFHVFSPIKFDQIFGSFTL
jgi:hypothetical protein